MQMATLCGAIALIFGLIAITASLIRACVGHDAKSHDNECDRLVYHRNALSSIIGN